MKRIFSIFFIFLFIISISINAYSAAETVNFSLQSAEAKKDRIVTLDLKCDNSNALAAGIFEFTYNKSILEFRGTECDDGIKVKYNETDNNIKLVYHNQSERSVESGVIFKIKFKTLDYGEAGISYKAYQCVDNTPNDINVGKCSAGNINVKPNAVETENVSGSKSSSAASEKEKSKKNKKSNNKSDKSKDSENADNDVDDDSDDFDDFDDSYDSGDSDKSPLENLGDLNDVEESSGNNALLYFILIGIGVLILALTVIQIIKKLRAKKNNKTNKN